MALSGVGLALTTVFLLGFLRPLSIWRHPQVVPTAEALATALGTDLTGALRFAIPTLLAFSLFAVALWVARRIAGPMGLAVVAAGTLLFSLALIPINPLGAHDAYYHVGNARTLWIYGENPLVLSPAVHADDPFYPNVASWQDFPPAYGPVWYAISGLFIPFVGDGLWPNVLALKVIAALSLFGTMVLAMLIAEPLRPGSAVAAGILVGWNPLLQWETAGNPHNDVLVGMFALGAIYAVVRRWWVAVFPLLALSVATKYVLVLLAPVLLLWLLRRRDVPRRQVGLSLLLGVALGIALYLPFWAGADTFLGFRRQANLISSSPPALLHTLLWSWFPMDGALAATIMKLVVVPPFLLGYFLLLRRVRRDGEVTALIERCFWIIFLLLMVVTWWFWPWYLGFLVPLGALLPGSRPAMV
ncbi:MAG TPA: hypothetical protein VGW38_12445, partial [Chloroflexota bacterium]|nr:hypothetical protein [Chloroflexota bacterium]